MELGSLILAVLAVIVVHAEDQVPLAVQERQDERALSPLMQMSMRMRNKMAEPTAEASSMMAMDNQARQAVAAATTAYYAVPVTSASTKPTVTTTTTKAPAPATTAAPAPVTTKAPAPATTAAYTAAPGPTATTKAPAPATTAAPAPGTTATYTAAPAPATKPNIIVFVADDLGRADISYTQGNLQVPTPDIDRLAWDGIILNRHYSNPICTPTRGAFMTGKYVFHIGMQTQAIGEAEPWGMPLNHPTQADLFRSIGYSTWHLGKRLVQYLPNGRGFDYTLGVTGGACNWFNYTVGWITPVPTSGRDLRENGKEVYANITNNVYFPELINNAAERLIRDQDPKKPFYLYFATPVAHSGFEPYFGAQHTMPQFQLRPPVLNEQFKRLTEAVVNKGIANNTISFFFADNGGPLARHALTFTVRTHASNWPLRMGKGSLFEGGVRVPGFIWSPLLKKRGRVTNQLFHVTDGCPLWGSCRCRSCAPPRQW
ncbi:putative Arylsulfatase J [Hypsibius exemplaris]|uniref:Arylsulfatase J n=1 Tax=Hypsibius exemplaris TaxID=2072580 RepID=A0A1W0WQ62_HYPEX|nr:putative Arylsulfatase J [Hypsibius exemplaris]